MNLLFVYILLVPLFGATRATTAKYAVTCKCTVTVNLTTGASSVTNSTCTAVKQ